jgi:tetratricopeptide (TPR) repeat protein
MKTQSAIHLLSSDLCAAAVAIILFNSGCGRHANQPSSYEITKGADLADPLAWVLAMHDGEDRLDEEIRRCQAQLRAGPYHLSPSHGGEGRDDGGRFGSPRFQEPEIALERLGWLFVAKARESFDPGFYRLAEQCALGLDSRKPGSPEAMLLRGHALQNQHRFKEAEPLARELVRRRGLPFDYGLLGDVLMEQGQLVEATDAYQMMIDLRPDLHSYARGAHLRWLKGDLAGAAQLMHLAASASSPLDPESAAWVHTRLAFYLLQEGASNEADCVCDQALEFQKDYPPALLLRGRIRLAQRNGAKAIEALQVAAKRSPLPEYQWALAEALRQENRVDEAEEVESQLRKTGAANDPRTYALYLATCGNSATTALRLAQQELKQRADVLTYDALAWSLAATGKIEEAQRQMEKALAEGTKDGRLYFHAAVIAAKSGQLENARLWFEKASDYIHMLLPSEQQQLHDAGRRGIPKHQKPIGRKETHV